MTKSVLWAINSHGQVYGLSTAAPYWEKTGVNTEIQDFKCIAAEKSILWSIGSDQQIYIKVLATGIPIRVEESTYENQRYRVFKYGGWTDQLIFSDRYNFSSEDGTQHLRKDGFSLPSPAWKWESDWHIQESTGGQLLGSEGWMFAFDFPRKWHCEQQIKSFVRRRKWIRFRVYTAFDKWVKVPGLGKDFTEEPFISIAVGGQELSGMPSDYLAVWAVTIQGRVFYRQGIAQNNPEGYSWVCVSTAPEVNYIAVGPNGLVWVVTWSGRVLARGGITRENLTGNDWYEVDSPGDPIILVTVGSNAVWALGRDGMVWFRKDVCGVKAGSDRTACIGTGWVQMMTHMAHLSIGPNDQVFGIGRHDRKLYYRTGVTAADLSGKVWRPLEAKPRPVLTNAYSTSSMSSLSARSLSDDESLPNVYGESLDPGIFVEEMFGSPQISTNALRRETLEAPPGGDSCNERDSKLSVNVEQGLTEITENTVTVTTEKSRSKGSFSSDVSDNIINFCETVVSSAEAACATSLQQQCSLSVGSAAADVSSMPHDSAADTSRGGATRESDDFDPAACSLSSQRSRETSLSEHDSSRCSSMTSMDQICGAERVQVADWLTGGQVEDVRWSWVSASACVLEPSAPPDDWFTSGKKKEVKSVKWEAWYRDITRKLRERNNRQKQPFLQYEHAIFKKSWVKKGDMHVWHERNGWMDCKVEFEQLGATQGTSDGTLTCSYSKHRELKHIVMLSHCHRIAIGEITCILRIKDPTKYSVFAVYTPKRTGKGMPLKLATASDKELEEWMKALTMGCRDVRCIKASPSYNAAWSTTDRGDIFVHNMLPHVLQYTREPNSDQLSPSPVVPINFLHVQLMYWYQVAGHMQTVESSSAGVVWGLSYNRTPWFYTGFLCSDEEYKQIDVRNIHIYENQRWNPLTGYSHNYRLPTDRAVWSDESGREQLNKEHIKPPSVHWQWISDWAIDYSQTEGTDKEGWQYATDFPFLYHKRKRMSDTVRRRRWFRKCRLATSGPWQQVESVSLQCISLQTDPPTWLPANSNVAVWAVDLNGNVLCRLGVTKECPQGLSWSHVPADQPFVHISVGGSYRVWGIAKDGSACLRNGVLPQLPNGTCWFQVPPPPHHKLSLVSAGKSTVWALDTVGNLYYRKDVLPIFPEGTTWQWVCAGIQHVSVGPHDQVWAIANLAHWYCCSLPRDQESP
ncbi:PREDICTED: tectonin beta-propeller repeat-containing protein 1-like [Priapulus caudatus]|uniref:Tectonin beta-propeller repeat-containing protein 1-like n=1 Tax=Priapulus caudatus TaxID=37621 RepID=A0ABM1DZ71_PRICU|nr:PREDICTED: tectonin beta-propeller repeat-containing protein 1-like [Priapulus caudatus]